MDEASILSLPDDPVLLKRMLAQRTRERDELQAAKQQIEQDKQAVEFKLLRVEVELLRYKKWYYGPRADRLTSLGEVNQLLLAFGQDLDAKPAEQEAAGNAASATAISPESSASQNHMTTRRIGRGRRDLAAFEHLPVSRQVYDLSENDKPCPCCGQMRQKIGEESSWQIEYIPGHFERIEHVRVKYACKHCEQSASEAGPQITRADKPSLPIDKGLAGPGLLAYVIVSKYSDYLPLYRLEGIFERNGFEIDRATQSLWCRDVAELIRPLYDLMVQRVKQSHLICTDDTIMPMLAPEKTRSARMWVYVGDEDHPYNIFDFTLSRSRDGPENFLQGYNQTLLADAYGGYDGVVVSSQIRRAGCWAHARRKFVDAEKAHPAIAKEAVEMIRKLYAIEDKGKGLSVGERLAFRQAKATPILLALKDRLHSWRTELLPKHPMAQAVAYTLNQWEELNVYAADGAVPIDNNISEREMKRIVLNRKNSLFVGNERGGQTAAILSSLTSTCRRHGVNPQLYLTQLLLNLPATPMSQLPLWLPDQWKQRQPAPTP